ncbi:DUF2637 domain-containing protein [Streptomyces sp. NBC_00820]|uniref:DUF2637 domain-containing protein n=1 Tax=Streptomyces sp. NBC_00820 TaxID=2975842 RepID=UPI002ED64D42|nr:DUF2637 domain-containing protein [Streptomyces sp. NBC_00820]
MDRYYDEAHLYSPQYPLSTEHDTLSQYGSIPFPAQQSWSGAAPAVTLNAWDLDEELAHMLSAAPDPEPAPAPAAAPVPTPAPAPAPLHRQPSRSERRHMQRQSHLLPGDRRITHATILIAVIAVCAASLLGWSITYTYGQLRTIAESVLPGNLAHWWPLTVYGPWFVAALSILRATIQHQRAPRSWGVILTASAMAVALCVSHSSRSLLAYVMLGVPPITALVCFWELVGQVSSKYRTRQGAHAQHRSGT